MKTQTAIPLVHRFVLVAWMFERFSNYLHGFWFEEVY